MKSNEKNFIRRLQNGKEDALEFIIDHYLPLIKGITYKVLGQLGNEGMIEECMNDVFLSVWNHSEKFKGNSSEEFKKWIYSIAKFKAIDYYRKAVKRTETASDYVEMKNENSAEDELIQLENRAELMKLINELDELDRNIFMMKYFLGIKSEEIAVKLDMTKASVDNRIYRAKKKLNYKVTNLKFGGNVI
ncbi:sigma-70 family RNA polymerase sigma factor [Metabacillus fastidiosus]|uniref:sigma-70 family RNA polymerase sigma factor n=1 Tax=Metabacillus fastidiosus TaxID=1458 RepID=UPI002DBF4127|nr:sigma-70 family RNA polymerase sigma factor [Metabacillus fastidiosus]MEC2077140.1 sigma-70 family RNA polymerase sigma factor [Metabacillus fastidiosus]